MKKEIADKPRKSEEELERLRRQCALILNLAGEGICGLDLEGNITFANPKAGEFLGYEPGELLGKPAQTVFHHRQSDGSKYTPEGNPFSDCLRGAEKRGTTDVFWRKDGSLFCVDYVCAPIKDEQARITGAIVMFKDVTEHVRGEALLELQEHNYRLLFETNPNAMWIFETEALQILAINEAAVSQYGYSRDEFLKLTLKDLFPPEDLSDLMKSVSSAPSPAYFSGQYRYVTKDGSLLFIEAYSAPIIWEGVRAGIVAAIDTTERQNAERRLREQADIINRAHDAVIIRDFKTDLVISWNSDAERMYGWSATEAIGRSLGELIFPDSTDREVLLEQLSAKGEFHGEIKHRAKDGREVVVDSRVTLIRDGDGTPRTVLGINTDITERRKRGRRLLRATPGKHRHSG